MDATVRTESAAIAITQQRRRAWLAVLAVVLAAIALIGAGWWLAFARYYQSTDDAYVAGDLVNANSQLSGTVVSIGADETDRVQAGQELVRLDATDARIALQDAEQQLARTVRQTRTVFANRDELLALVGERTADLTRAQSDFDRRQSLVATGAVSAEELGHARDALAAARDALTAAQKNLAAGRALAGRDMVADHPDVQAAATRVERAWLDLERTSVRAPVSGYVARRVVQLGEHIAPGAPLMAIVPLERLRVDANFKEVQLTRLRIGQPVEVIADVYGRATVYHGRIAGVGLGTGAAFALLPAQNATGNWIKVVQRVPVRVTLDSRELAAHPLRIGLSTRATADTHDTSGLQLAPLPPREPVLATGVFDLDNSEIRSRIAQIIAANSREASEPAALQR
jgi:membrane fusion protein, multidrug efflux system